MLFVEVWMDLEMIILMKCIRRRIKHHMISHIVINHFCATLWTVACQAPLSMGFCRQE